MAKVTFIVENEHHEIELAVGETLLKGGLKLNLDENGFGNCGGNCVCSTCHVYVKSGGESFAEPSIDEEDLLEPLPNLEDNSRLACQLKITAETGDVVVEVAKEE